LDEYIDKSDKNLDCNFTHRAALGGGDDADRLHGSMDALAKQQLEVLK
jgi:hypothetical protein